MTFFAGMTDTELDAEIERLVRDIVGYENRYDAEYQTKNDVEKRFNQGFIKEVMEEKITSRECVMNERRHRMGFWISP